MKSQPTDLIQESKWWAVFRAFAKGRGGLVPAFLPQTPFGSRQLFFNSGRTLYRLKSDAY